MSVAAVCPRAADEEHWRYLPAGIRFLLSDFSTVEIVPEVSSIGGFFRTNNWSLSILVKNSLLRTILHHTFVPIMNLLEVPCNGPFQSTMISSPAIIVF